MTDLKRKRFRCPVCKYEAFCAGCSSAYAAGAQARQDEIVAWLREYGDRWINECADDIESGAWKP